MSGMSRFDKVVLGLTGAFVLVTGTWFLAKNDVSQPYQVTTLQRPPAVESGGAEETGGSRPDSLLPGETININVADVYDLQRLPGIGEARARDIVADREKNGPFQTVDDLDRVSGIGPGIIDGLREYAEAGAQ